MNKLFFLAFICFFFQNYAQENSGSNSLFDEKRLLTHLQNLSSDAFEGRRTGTKGAKKARKYIVNEFHKQGIKPLGKYYEQPFSFYKNRQVYQGANILGFVKGNKYPTKFIVVSAHYDHEGVKMGEIYNGADDNASGVSALFSFAEYFKKNPPKYSVILAAFDAEELGILGSKYFLQECLAMGKNIVLNINMDMISRSRKEELFVVGARNSEILKAFFLPYKTSAKSIKVVLGHDKFDSLDDWTYSSDHTHFFKEGIPFLYFGVEDHEDYHEPTDDFENINPEFYKQAVKEIITIFNKIDKSQKF